MARKILLDTQYTFTPSTNTIVIPNRYVPQERMILITNVSKNKVIYNFSDPSLKAITYTNTTSGASGSTTIVLNYNCSTMSSTDKLQITIDEYSEAMRPSEETLDPVGKLRTSTPQALIDTDFEYGTQVSKWENLTMINNRPLAYQTTPNIGNLGSITMFQNQRLVTVATTTPHYMSPGQPIVVQDTYLSIANGNYIIDTVPNANSFTYTAKAMNSTTITSILDANKTAIYQGATYTGANIGPAGSATITNTTGSQLFTVTTAGNHGLAIGNEVYISGTTAANSATATVTTVTGTGTLATYTTSAAHGFMPGQYVTVTGAATSGFNVTSTVIVNVPSTTTFILDNSTSGTSSFTSGTAIANYAGAGANFVATVTSPTIFSYYAPAGSTGALNTTATTIYVRPQGQFLHRAFDGGVIFTSNGNSNYEQAIRQTRRYFRYQSGKGIQVSTGTIIKPNLQLDALTSSGTTVTAQTREQHNIQPGTTITVLGANETAYNGTFTVTSVTGYNTFQYTALTTPSATVASGGYYVNVTSWYGASNRMGYFDQQNGAFWEYDGQQLYVVRRNSTFQLSGKVSVVNGGTTVSQTNSSFPTNFSRQVSPGDFIVLRGASYRVTEILNDTTLNITPAYRGTTDNYVIVSKTVETRIPSSQFNIDKLDGTGPSGYIIDLTKMQMWYVDFSWYGAGFIRWGIRGIDGNIYYVHKMANNNVNTEAWMRSGNLSGRYESSTIPPVTTVTSTIGSTDVAINVADTSKFPSSGTLQIRNASTGIEYVNYTGKTATTFTGLTRGQAGATSLAVTIAAGSNIGTDSSTSGLQVGQKIVSQNSATPTSVFYGAFPDGTFISAINGTSLTFSQAALISNPYVTVAPMGYGSGQAFTINNPNTAPTSVELAYPTYAPSISHWGTSVIMDGGFDDDKSLLFTYGQINPVIVPANATRNLFSIRIAPSVDNGVGAGFGQRELINRMQLVLRTLDITTPTAGAQILVKAQLNSTSFAGSQLVLGQSVGTTITASSAVATGSVITYTTSATHGLNVGQQVVLTGFSSTGFNIAGVIASIPSGTTFTVNNTLAASTATGTGTVLAYANWTNAVGNVYGTQTSSLAQIADYAPGTSGSNGSFVTTGGETTGGFFVNTTGTSDISKVRDLGNAILGGGGVGSLAYSNSGIYPDGPDVLTITVTNVTSSPLTVQGRISWTEAQA